MENVATYSEARSEYTKQLATFIVPTLVTWFQQLWERNAGDRQRNMALFQTECEEIPRWNADRIHDEVRVLIEKSGCDYMEELVTAVFIAHTKVLTAVRLGKKQTELSITVPKLDHFIHRVFRESARNFWKVPFLFVTTVPVMERQKNLLQIEALATEAITSAVRSMLPVKEILHRYLEADTEEVDEEEEATAEAVPVAPSTVPTPASTIHSDGSPDLVEAETEAEPPVPPAPETPVTAPTDVSATATEVSDASGSTPSTVRTDLAPAVVQIETEPTVSFADYDTVFDEKAGRTEMRYSPKEDEEDDDLYAAASDALQITGEATAITAEDAEDLEAPAPVAPVRAAATVKETIDDEDYIALE
jgi:hypothetical protein